ncbi:protein DipZ [Abditibacteriota bacterium]|nr:protein DipZ [Abditibacteriota bacterium]
MEPWKIAVIAALGFGIIGFGKVVNTPPGPVDPISNTAVNPVGVQPTPGPPANFAKYMGATLPAWPTVTQWANTPGPVNLGSLKGKMVLLEVFRIECSHCQEAAPFLVKLHARYAPRGVDFVGIQSPGAITDPANPEINWATVQKWIKTQGYTWPVGFDANSAWFQGKFGKNVSYPSLFLFDKSGKIVFIQSGHNTDKAMDLIAELEHIAPGQGDVKAQATDLSRFLSPALGIRNDAKSQQSLTDDFVARLNAIH